MSKSPKNPPSEAVVAEAIKFIRASRKDICSFKGTDSDQQANVRQLLSSKCLLNCNSQATASIMAYLRYVANPDDGAGNPTDDRMIIKIIEKVRYTDMERLLKASEYDPIITDPLEAILNVKEKVFGCCHVYGSDSLLTDVNRRHVSGGKLVKTTLLNAIRQHINKKPAEEDNDPTDQAGLDDVTIIVGGPSGGGKTDSLIAQSQRFEDGKPQVVVAYIHPPTDLKNLTAEEIRDSPPKVPKLKPGLELCKPAERNAIVLDWLVDELLAIIPIKIIRQLMKITEAKPLQLLIVVDEVGGEGFNCLVRALCAIKPSEIHTLFLKRIPDEHIDFDTLGHEFFPNVTFRLAAAGTGIGVSEEGNVGSLPSDYETFWAYDGSQDSNDRESNRAVFMAYLEIVRPLDQKRIHRLFWDLISENARMAAILGSQLSRLFVVFDKEADYVELLYMFDLTQFIGNAVFRFKRMNGLKLLRQDELWEILLKAVRMHWFPNALTRGMDALQTTRGMIVDRSMWSKNLSGEPAVTPSGESTKMMPPFTTSLLGMLCGNPVITQSIVSGASLEEYTLTLFFLLACAACDFDLFLAALNERQLVPLTKEKAHKAKDRPLQSLVHDLQRDCDKKGIVTEAKKAGDAEKLLQAVTDAIGHFTYTIKGGEPGEHHVAAFRVFDKMSFADTFLIDNNKMILIQVKDYEKGYKGEKLDLEQYKMGSVTSTAFQTMNLEYMTPSLKFFKTSLGKLVDASKSTILNKKTKGFVNEIHSLLQKAKSESDTEVFESLRKLLKKDKTQKPALIEKVNKLVDTSEANMNAKLYMPRRLIRDLCLAWHKRTGKKVTDIYRCFVTPFEVDTVAIEYEPLCDEVIDIPGESPADGWSAMLQGRDLFVSVEHVQFFKFDRNRTRMAPYAVRKLPSVLLVKESELTPQGTNAPAPTPYTIKSKRLKRERDDAGEASEATATDRSTNNEGTKKLRAEVNYSSKKTLRWFEKLEQFKRQHMPDVPDKLQPLDMKLAVLIYDTAFKTISLIPENEHTIKMHDIHRALQNAFGGRECQPNEKAYAKICALIVAQFLAN